MGLLDFYKKSEKPTDKKINEKDVSWKVDALGLIQNLIHLEMHFAQSYFQDKNKQYLELYNQARKDRTEILDNIVINPKNEEWCITKHALACVGYYMELGSRELSLESEEASKYMEKASYWLAIVIELNNIGGNKNV